MSNNGTIYFLINSAMPGLVKIGRTAGTIEARLRQLSATGVPQPFQVVATFQVTETDTCEKSIHDALAAYRPNKNREFFNGPVHKLLELALPIIGRHLCAPDNNTLNQTSGQIPDEDDVYFMQYLLHDSYEEGIPMGTEQLAEHHLKYAPLELEYKLLKLADIGMIERQNKGRLGMSTWSLTPAGLKFMFESGNVLHDLIEEARPSAQSGAEYVAQGAPSTDP